MHTKHVPVRRCVVCGVRVPQRELVRVAYAPDGELQVDGGGRRSGRGAYLCHNPECWQKVLKGNRLSNALRSELTEAGRSRLAAYSDSLREQTA